MMEAPEAVRVRSNPADAHGNPLTPALSPSEGERENRRPITREGSMVQTMASSPPEEKREKRQEWVFSAAPQPAGCDGDQDRVIEGAGEQAGGRNIKIR